MYYCYGKMIILGDIVNCLEAVLPDLKVKVPKLYQRFLGKNIITE